METDQGYNSVGKQVWTKTPSGTITWNVLDARGDVLSTWIGTNAGATPAYNGGNMVEVASYAYNADGDVTSSTQYDGYGHSYTTYAQYDWRDRQIGALGPDGVATILTLDNLGRTTETDTYSSATYNSTIGQITTSSGNLRAKSTSSYDPLGRVYETDTYNVAQSGSALPGTVGDRLPTDAWFDAAGNVIKTETGTTGSFQKSAYDGLGQLTNSYVGYDTAETTGNLYDTSGNVTLHLSGNTILQQNQTWYDAAGESVATATYEQFADGTPVTGPLDATNSYATASATWYDGIGRAVANANFGREDAAAGSVARHFFNSDGSLNAAADGLPTITEQTPLAPNSSDAYIATATAYNSAGFHTKRPTTPATSVRPSTTPPAALSAPSRTTPAQAASTRAAFRWKPTPPRTSPQITSTIPPGGWPP